MAAKKQDQDSEALSAVIAGFPEGASLEQIKAAARLSISKRTLIRRLADMVESGALIKSGTSRAARYRLAGAAKPPASGAKKPAHPDLFVPLSKAGSEVLRVVSRPMNARKAVGYNREFLDSYRPSKSSYLTAAEKARLHELGKTSGGEQPAGTYVQQILNRLLIDLSWNCRVD